MNAVEISKKERKEIAEKTEEAYSQLESEGKLELKIGLSKHDIDTKNLFGKFFDNRAAYYIIEKPEIFIGSARVLELTLYFVDDVLLRKKHVLHRDISNELVKAHGSFKFKPLDENSKQLIDDGAKILENKAINSSLTDYQLRWESDVIRRQYLVEVDSVGEEYTYYEEHPDYKGLLRNARLRGPVILATTDAGAD